jgi:uncharacterized protein YkwD
MAGPLAALGALVAIVRRTRVVPVALGALVLAAFALAAPIAPYDDDDAASTAALGSTSSGGQELVPATGDGWTQDGVPAATSPADEESRSSGSPSKSPSGSPSDSSSAAVDTTDATAARTSTGSSTPSSSSAASSARTSSSGATAASSSRTGSSSSSSSSPRTRSSGSDGSTSPSGTPSAPSETEAPTTRDPADEVLAAVNDARTAAGCTALTPDAGLASLATEHSAAMRDGDFVAVQSPDGGSPLDRGARTAVVAEDSDPAEVADDWLDDGILLDCTLTRGGVGTTGDYWTLLAA